MPDIRQAAQGKNEIVYNGKFIYQLTSAASLKDTDLFAISTSNYLTRSVSLKQIKSFVTNDFYDKDDIQVLLDELRKLIQDLGDDIFNLRQEITDFENHVEETMNDIRNTLNKRMDLLEKTLNERIDNLEQELNTKIDNLENKHDQDIQNLREYIDNVQDDLEEMIRGWILYGISAPSSLATGRVYLQYFEQG